MKIVFNKLQTSKETIQISLDGGTSWKSYVVSEIIETGIPLDDSQDYEKIQIKGSASVLKNLDVIKSIEIPENSTTTDGIFTYDLESKEFGSNITGVKVPEGYNSIGTLGLAALLNLTSVELPESLTTIGDSAFSYCSGLTSIDLPASLTSIGQYAFGDCTSLTSIDLPEGVTTIGDSAFRNCTGLTSIELPESLTTIGQYAFGDCTSLTSIELPESLTTIGDSAFQNCTGLTSIELPESLTSIGYYAFYKCTSLTSIIVPDKLEWGSDTFPSEIEYITYKSGKKCLNKVDKTVKNYTIDPNTIKIGISVFQNCTGLTSIELPESLTSIGYYAFGGCTSLKTINFKGTEDQWNAITKRANWKYNCPSDMVINFNYQGE